MVQLSMTLSEPWPGISRSQHFSKSNTSEMTRDRAIVTIQSYALYRMVTFPVTLSDLWHRFQGHDIIEGEQYGQSFYRTLIGNDTQSIEWYHFQWPWVTSEPDFKVTTFLKSNIWKNGASQRQTYYCTRIGNYTYHMELCYILWPWLTSESVARVCQHQLSFLLTK